MSIFIRRLIFVMPILMTLVAIVLCVVMAVMSGRMRLWIEVAEFAATVILLVGYSYVALTLILRPFAYDPAVDVVSRWPNSQTPNLPS